MKTLVCLCAIALLVPAPGWLYLIPQPNNSAPVSKRYALVVSNGSSKYGSSLTRQARVDAQDMARWFQELPFAMTPLPKSDLERALFDLNNRVKNGGTLVIYYAHHGIEFNGVNSPTSSGTYAPTRAHF